MADNASKPQVIARDSAGRAWLYLDLLDGHNERVVFVGADGTRRPDLVNTWDVFEWKGVVWEVQGHDRPRRRCWVEPVTLPDSTSAGDPSDPRGGDGRPGWSENAA